MFLFQDFPEEEDEDEDGNENEAELCDEELVKGFEDEERRKGILSEEEIKRRSSEMIGRFLERKWKREGEGEVSMASGRVRRLPGCGNVCYSEQGIWNKLDGF